MLDVRSKRLQELNARYQAVAGRILPMEMISHSEPYETQEKHIEACEKAGKDLLPEIYGWDLSGHIYY